MINDQELLFVVDKNNKPLKPKPRNYVHKQRLWHRTTGIWVINNNRQILCQKRSLKKDVNPGFWEAFFGGHLEPNVDYLASAVREVNEELALSISEKDLAFYKIFPSDQKTHREYQAIFSLLLKDTPKHFYYEKDEIDELQWKNIDEVKFILLEKKLPNWVKKPWDKEVLNWL